MNKGVIIIGAGGHGGVIADIVLSAGDHVLGFLDDDPQVKACLGISVIGAVKDYVRFPDAEFVIAVGSAMVRERIAGQLTGVKWYTAVHPSAVISSRGTSLGEGTVVMANVVINSGTQIGRHCIVNTAAAIDHDGNIGDFAHVSVGAKVAGAVSVGTRTWVGIGAVLKNNLTICGDCMIGAGAVVVQDITEPGAYVGVPAKRIS